MAWGGKGRGGRGGERSMGQEVRGVVGRENGAKQRLTPYTFSENIIHRGLTALTWWCLSILKDKS